MDAARQYAYRTIVYIAVTYELRAHLPIGSWNPFTRKTVRSRLARNRALADLIHNVAEFSRRDFEGFDEIRFWNDYDNFTKEFPDGLDYRQKFADQQAQFDAKNR